MANEKRLIPDGKEVTLDELLPGTIFAFGDDCIAVKSEYRCDNGLIEAFIIDSGEQFWGGVHTAKEQNKLLVRPLTIVEVVHGRWIGKQLDNFRMYQSTCSVCGWVGVENYDSYCEPSTFYYCPNCGANMMDGDGNA